MKKNILGILGLILPLFGIFRVLVLPNLHERTGVTPDLFSDVITLFILCIFGIAFSVAQMRRQVTILSSIALVVGGIGIILGIYVEVVVFNPIYNPTVCGWQSCTTRQTIEYEKMKFTSYKDCEVLPENSVYRYYCIRHFVLERKDVALCKLAANANNCYMDVSFFLDDIKICDKIDEEQMVSECYSVFVTKSIMSDRQKIDLCELLPDPDACYWKMATDVFHDSAMCVKLSNSKKYDEQECYDVNDEYYYAVVQSTRDHYRCDLISSKNKKQDCYDGIFMFYKDASPHTRIGMDKSLCDKLSTEELKEDCIDLYQSNYR